MTQRPGFNQMYVRSQYERSLISCIQEQILSSCSGRVNDK